MLHDPARHEPLRAERWDEQRVRACIARIVAGLEDEFIPGRGWRVHPLDDPASPDEISPSLYYGATGVIWALGYLRDVGAADLRRTQWLDTGQLLDLTRRWLGDAAQREQASFLAGETPIRLLQLAQAPELAIPELERLVAFNQDNPARELMWGAPGTLLACLFLHRRTGDPRWAEAFRGTAAKLKSQMLWSGEHRCWYWTQDLYGMHSRYIDAVHGFAGTALPLIAGRSLLDDWPDWCQRITRTMQCTAIREDGCATWPATLQPPRMALAGKRLMQYCHGAPGFVVCLAGMPPGELDALLLEAGEATWRAGPLAKGSNLCHGTGGNGYAFLKLFRRTGDPMWLDRARAFAMHGIGQFEADAARFGMLRASLWTGDAGFAVFLWDCVRGVGEFPTLDVFYPLDFGRKLSVE